MGGKVWLRPEERVFWTVCVKIAPPGLHKESKAVKHSLKDLKKSWKPLVKAMEDTMRDWYPGQTLPRKYTEISMYEHYFQNFVQGKLSPNAGEFVEEYKAWLKNRAENPESDTEADEVPIRPVPTPQESAPPSSRVLQGGPRQERDIPRPDLPTTHVDDQLPQSAGQQTAYDHAPTANDTSVYDKVDDLKSAYYSLFLRNGDDHVSSYGPGSQERPGKRARMMDNGQRAMNMSAHTGILVAQHHTSGTDQFSGCPPAGTCFPSVDSLDQANNNGNVNPFAQHHTSGGGQFPGVPYNMQNPAGGGFLNTSNAHLLTNNQRFNFATMQNTIDGAQYPQTMYNMQDPPYYDSLGQINMVQGYPSHQTSHFGAQGNVFHFMGYGAAHFNNSPGIGRVGAQKRKMADL